MTEITNPECRYMYAHTSVEPNYKRRVMGWSYAAKPNAQQFPENATVSYERTNPCSSALACTHLMMQDRLPVHCDDRRLEYTKHEVDAFIACL